MLRRFAGTLAASAAKSRAASMHATDRLRNIAIIAHVDHGKSSLCDALLSQAGCIDSAALGSQVMDSNALEKERGITILSKTASFLYSSHRVNLVDTPGHADFGGEVERVLSMVDGVALLVDATEGPMTQTRFVLSKALQQNLRPLVVINKVDRPTARLDEVETELLDLFLALDASDAQLDYPLLYASAKEGWATDNKDHLPGLLDKSSTASLRNMKPLFDAILKHVPPPPVDRWAPFSMLVTQLESDPFLGKCCLGRIQSGAVKIGDKVNIMNEDGSSRIEGKIVKLFSRDGLERVPVNEAIAGDIISIAGVSKATVNSTICHDSVSEPIKSVPIDPPTVSVTFTVNDSPLQGNDGSKLTSSMIRERLLGEVETNVALQVHELSTGDGFEVRGRGELHLGILIENMRREGFEFAISPPRVLMHRKKKTKQVLEPMEEVIIDVPTEMSGSVIQKLQKRKGEMKNYVETDDRVRLSFLIPSRGLLGYVSEFKNETSGQGVINHLFVGYGPYKGEVDKTRKGSLVASNAGVATPYGILNLEPRGALFVKPGDKVYPGMVVGEHNKEHDIDVNPAKEKQLTNVRAVSKDDFFRLTPPRIMSLEQILSYIQDNEMVEVTPKSIRIRKAELNSSRRRANSKKEYDGIILEVD